MGNIKENYVSFEMARILKEKGFDEKCFTVYSKTGILIHYSYFKIDYTKQEVWAPTLQMARAFLRKLGIEIFINKANEVSKFDSNRILRAFYFFDIVNSQGVCKDGWSGDALKNDYDSYEIAEREAINYVLQNWDWLMKEMNDKLQNLKKNNKREEELIKIQEKEEREKNGE